MPNSNQEPPGSSEAPNQDLKETEITETRYHMKIKIKISKPSQEPPASSKATNEDSKDMDVLCTFKIKIGN